MNLARLAAQVERGSADERLVRSRWDAVKARHDIAQAREALTLARDPWPAVPEAAAYPAIYEAVRAKTDDMTDNAINYYATQVVRDAVARRAGDSAAYMQAEQRRDDLPDEIAAAQVTLYRAQLADAWATAEANAEAEHAAYAAMVTAGETRAAYLAALRPVQRTAQETGEVVATVTQHKHDLVRTTRAYRAAHHATALALAHVTDLEDAIEDATGERPEPGAGMRAAVPPFTANFTAHDPRHGTPDEQYGQSIKPVFFRAGTTPPRWAAWRIGHGHPTAWRTTASAV